jgi:hypothetical protein
VENRLVGTARDFKNEPLPHAGGYKIGVDALSQLGGIDADNIVLAAVIRVGPAKNLCADLLFVDLRAPLPQRPLADIEQEIAQPRRAAELLAGGDTLDERAALFDAGLSFGNGGLGIGGWLP